MDNIGEILKNTRLDKGLSLEQVEEATSIRKIYLAAIETGDYAKIPGDVFTKGIIRTYGNYLGLNGPELVTLYKAACAGVDPEEIKPAEIRTTSTAKKFFEYFYLSAVICVVSYNCCCRLYFLIQQQ